jgi:hypothetical protein
MDVIWWVTAVVGAIAVNLIASELFAWGPRLSEWLMRCAVRRLAPEMQDRMREEWAGHLQTIPPGLWRIVAAAGFYLATHQINVALRVRSCESPRARQIEEIVAAARAGARWSRQMDIVRLITLPAARARLRVLEESVQLDRQAASLMCDLVLRIAATEPGDPFIREWAARLEKEWEKGFEEGYRETAAARIAQPSGLAAALVANARARRRGFAN